MDPHHAAMIAKDEREALDLAERAVIDAKLTWYALSRPYMSATLRRELLALSPRLAKDPVFGRVGMFLNGDGGMFKKYAYGRSDALRAIPGSRVLVPGIGYGQNLMQLAAFRPKEIVAFDLYDYPNEWPAVAALVKAKFGVPVTFLKGDFDAVPASEKGTFDHILSDAVLEHVPDMPKFAEMSRAFLKPGGVFYASFGPLWYGPGGDHADWGPGAKMFDHVLLSKEQYEHQVRTQPPHVSEGDSCDTGFMIKEGLYSYLKSNQYFDELAQAGFAFEDVRAKVRRPAVEFLAAHPEMHAALDAAGVPAFDRFCGGFYIWARSGGAKQ